MPSEIVVGTNSYISLDNTDTYFDDRLHMTAWTGASADDKARALIQATKAIDRQFLKGRKKLADQALAFPRCYVVDKRAIGGLNYIGNVELVWDGSLWCETEVPQAVKDACCEEALFRLAYTEYELHRERQHALGIVGGSVGRANEYSVQAIVQAKRKGFGLCPDAYELLKPFLAGVVGIT